MMIQKNFVASPCGNIDRNAEGHPRGCLLGCGRIGRGSYPMTTSIESENKNELTLEETERLFPVAAELISQSGWDQVSQTLAVALAMQQVCQEQAPRIHQLAQELLQLKAAPAKRRAG